MVDRLVLLAKIVVPQAPQAERQLACESRAVGSKLTRDQGLIMRRIPTLAEVERRHILNTLHVCGNNRTHAAKALGLPIRCLRMKLISMIWRGSPYGRSA